jgi:sucrose phosphorylase
VSHIGASVLASILHRLHGAGIRAIRLDAVGASQSEGSTSCFMIPETFAFIAGLTAQAHALDVEVLVGFTVTSESARRG